MVATTEKPRDDHGEPAEDTAGTMLASARMAAGLSVDEVSARTRIRATLIRQMEQDDFSGVGGAVYARGHIRSIARTLGIDPEPVLAAYNATHAPPGTGPLPIQPSATSPGAGGTAAPAGLARLASYDPLRHGEGRSGARRWGTAMVVSVAVLCLLALFVTFGPGSGGGEDDGAPTAATPPAAGTPEAPAAPPSEAPQPTTPPPTGVNLRLEAVDGPSWLEVTDQSNQLLFQELLPRGDTRTLTAAESLRVKMGNAGAMDLSCNGRSLGPLGGDGQVVTVLVALTDSGDCAVNPGAPVGTRAAPPTSGPSANRPTA
ncbi:MAG: helix-turn-helix domain-containing protein [Frankia sp.]|nr:helix-turn-helix domain-containing protein [Frankia sp.]